MKEPKVGDAIGYIGTGQAICYHTIDFLSKDYASCGVLDLRRNRRIPTPLMGEEADFKSWCWWIVEDTTNEVIKQWGDEMELEEKLRLAIKEIEKLKAVESNDTYSMSYVNGVEAALGELEGLVEREEQKISWSGKFSRGICEINDAPQPHSDFLVSIRKATKDLLIWAIQQEGKCI